MPLLPDTARRLEALLCEAQSTGRAPSLIAGVVRDGELVEVLGAGTTPTPHRDLQYRIGSISKTLTATLLLQLRDAGQLGLDDPVERHLPGTPLGPLTLRQLMGHASGLQREPDGDWWERCTGGDLDALLAGLTPAKLGYPPHRVYHYSNLAYGLLGGVLERVTGISWWELLRQRLLEPLGMTRTTYQASPPYAAGYVVHPWRETLREEPRTDAGAMAPAGQLWSTITDLAKWAAFVADPQPAVLAPETLAEMSFPVAIDPDTWRTGHGLGLELYRVDDRVYVGHGGSMPGYVSALVVHRPTRTGVVAYANSYGFRFGNGSISALAQQLLTTVLDAEPARVEPWRPATAPPPDEAAELLGRWWWMGREHEAHWAPEQGELVLTALRPAGPVPWRFRADGTDRWRGSAGMNDGEPLIVRRDQTGRVVALDIATFVFHRDPDQES